MSDAGIRLASGALVGGAARVTLAALIRGKRGTEEARHIEQSPAIPRLRLVTSAPTGGAAHPSLDDVPRPSPTDAPSDPLSAVFEALVGCLMESLSDARGFGESLAWVTLTRPPSVPVDALLADARRAAAHGWAVVALDLSGREHHVHSLLVFDRDEAARAFIDDASARHGLAPSAQHVAVPIGGWRSRRPDAHRVHVARIAAYALKLGKHSTRRASEVPTDVRAWGDLAPAEAASRFALSPTSAAPVARSCACGCGQSITGRLDQRCATAACRRRVSRRRAREATR